MIVGNIAVIIVVYSIMNILKNAILVVGFSMISNLCYPQGDPELRDVILKQDSLFWIAYNTCDVDKMVSFLTDDLEFYHDKGGLTSGLDIFTKQLKTGLCSPQQQPITRKAIEEKIKVFPLSNYGAIISGDHLFHIDGTIDSRAKFTHVWKFENNAWKMSRVLSYNHQPVPYKNDKVAVTLSNELLASYAGKYHGPQTGDVIIAKKGTGLEMQAGKMQMILHAQSNALFFHKESNLTFEFFENEGGKVFKFTVRENGVVVEEAKRIN